MVNNKRSTKGRIYILNDIVNNVQKKDQLDYIEFQFNPTEIEETRKVDYNFSKAQGQVLPLPQYSMIGNTEFSFTLLFHESAIGIGDTRTPDENIRDLRKLLSPKQFNKRSYYDQVNPPTCLLDLGRIGEYHGVITEANFNYKQYGKEDLRPIHVEVSIRFVCVSSGLSYDISTYHNSVYK